MKRVSGPPQVLQFGVEVHIAICNHALNMEEHLRIMIIILSRSKESIEITESRLEEEEPIQECNVPKQMMQLRSWQDGHSSTLALAEFLAF